MKLFFNIFFSVALLFSSKVFAANGNDKNVEILSSIKPIDSLVRMIVSDEEQENVDLIISGNQSPHGFSLKPSDVRKVNKAKIIFYIDDNFEEFLPKILENSPNIIRVDLAHKSNLRFFKLRDFELFKKEAAKKDDKNIDYHLWLDTKNAKEMLFTIKNELSKIYPQNSSIYEANYKFSIEKIDMLYEDLEKQLKAVQKEKFMVFHDAFQYFEGQFKLHNIGYITKNPHMNVSIKNLRQNMVKARYEKAKCVFSEYQFNGKFSNMVAKGAEAKVVPLDPIGFNLKPSKDLYFEVMRNTGKTFSECLSAKPEVVTK